MKSNTVYKTFETPERRAFIRITEDVQAAVDDVAPLDKRRAGRRSVPALD